MIQLSIVIPVLNEAPTIESHLIALKKVTSTIHTEIIVVDGGSQDNTVSLAKPFSDKVLLSEKGRAQQMNMGAEYASGKTLLFLHSDTSFPRANNSVDETFSFLKKNHKWGFYPVHLSGKHILFKIIARMMNFRSRLTSVATGDQCIFVDRDFFTISGQFSLIPLMEDVELSKRLRRIEPPFIASVKVTTDSRRWEKNGIIKTILLMWYLRALYFFGVSPSVIAQRYYKKK
jgi:rSAM/selenodomain-associated transferase 2